MPRMNTSDQQNILRQIPAVDQLLLRPAIAEWAAQTSREFVVSEIQKVLQGIRDAVRSGASETIGGITPERVESALIENLQNCLRPNLRTVINATGVILHTNLGRAPLSPSAQKSLSAFSTNYTNLEYDIGTGQRSHRDKLIDDLLREVLGCEAATVVNNNAAAVFLILNTLASGREVIVSRGELVEIGGSFRIPDIMARSGAALREVGTTNKTRIQDYRDAVGPNTALLLRVHPSNFRMLGFTERPDLREMVALARECNVLIVEDIGSGCLVDLKPYGIADEPLVQDSISAGLDLISFSGDKLLGGPQAGIIAGKRKLVELIRKNPLMRTYRVEKLIYGALEATLDSYRFGRAASEIPVVQMIAMKKEELAGRARLFARRLRTAVPQGVQVHLSEGNSVVGGGSCPECRLPTALVSVESANIRPNLIETRLRLHNPPVIVRLEEDKLLVDLRTVFPDQEKVLIDSLREALAN
jgi:L-seryl-tRNA(Ser) seleniumtransferase